MQGFNRKNKPRSAPRFSIDCKYFGKCAPQVAAFERRKVRLPRRWASVEKFYNLTGYGYDARDTRFYRCPQAECLLCPVTVLDGATVEHCDSLVEAS